MIFRYAFNVPQHANRGSRYYIMLRYDVVKQVSLWLKFSQTIYNNLDVVSSGNEQIDGNIKSEIKAQIAVNVLK